MNDVGVYKTKKYTAYIYPKKIVICTRLQCFKILQDRVNESLMNDLKLLIINGEVKRLDDIRDYNGRLKWNHTSKPSI